MGADTYDCSYPLTVEDLKLNNFKVIVRSHGMSIKYTLPVTLVLTKCYARLYATNIQKALNIGVYNKSAVGHDICFYFK